MLALSGITNKSLLRNKFSSSASLVCLLMIALQAITLATALELKSELADKQQRESRNANSDKESSSANRKSSLEAELDSMVQQHDGSFDPSDRSLADAIISRLMVDDLASELSTAPAEPSDQQLLGAGELEDGLEQQQQLQLLQPQSQFQAQPQLQSQSQSQLLSGGRSYVPATGAEALRYKKLLSMVQAYEAMLNGATTGVASRHGLALPMLPAGQAATSKRASKLAGNYLQQRQMIANSNGNSNGYGRNSFDFGLGKRPDAALRFGDSLGGGAGSGAGQPGNQFGKRPSAHRYDFGLGKRVASVSNHVAGRTRSLPAHHLAKCSMFDARCTCQWRVPIN